MSYQQKGGSAQLPARWFNNGATPFKGCNCPGSNCGNPNYSCGYQSTGQEVQEGFKLPTLADAERKLKQTVGKIVPSLVGGGTTSLPARFYNSNAAPFKGCHCDGSGCGGATYACGLNGGGDLNGGGCGSSQAIPKISYGNSEPVNPQALTLSQKAYQQGNTSFDNYNEYAQQPCNNFQNLYKYYGDFNAQGCGTANQSGGNGPVGAPFVYFNHGQPLTQHYPFAEGPRFAPVQYSPFW